MGGMDDSLAPLGGGDGAGEHSNGDSKKDPKTFLGTHADLVNLDNLVSKPPEVKNPFAMTIAQPAAQSNPFGVTQPKSVPLNQMSTSSSMGFTQPVGSNMLPTPLAPLGGGQQMAAPPPPNMYAQSMPPMGAPYAMPMQQQQQHATNPFL